ncbi:hypothetical protein ACIQBJ_31325 [Kitasatospora sp. NPDC088391]|uniref:hypothetical protein n=1 Tax=Kitasatospora sp. NPDC088391 TaxID=3364074 RepID=UPI0037F73C47
MVSKDGTSGADGPAGGSADGPADGPVSGPAGGPAGGSVALLVAALVQPSRAEGWPGPELLARVVRELHRLPRWQHALLAAGAAPLDVAARSALTETVTELLVLDPLLAAALAAPAPAPAPVPPPPVLPPPPTAPPVPAPPYGPPQFGPPPSGPPSAAPASPASPFDAPQFGPPQFGPPQFDAPPVPEHPFGAGTIVRRRGPGRRVWLSAGAVLVAGVLIGAGVYVLGGSDAPQLPGSVEGDRLRASSERGDYPDWSRASGRLVSGGMVDPHAALYGSLPDITASTEFGGSDREARWNVVVGKPSPAFERTIQDSLAKSHGDHAPRRVATSLPGTLVCDSYAADLTEKERAEESLTCVWYDAEHAIVVEGTGVPEGLPAAVLVRVHENVER